jgi:hypothetical protein
MAAEEWSHSARMIKSISQLGLSVISLVLGVAGAQAADLYVSTEGSDSNPGSSSSPLRTITRAYSLASAGTTIIVLPGTYTDYRTGWGIHLAKSGTASSPIILRSQVRGKAIVDGQNLSDRNQGFYITGSYNVVEGFEIRNSPHGGIAMYGNDNRILNNEIHHNGNPASTSSNGRDGVYSDKATSGNYYAGNSVHDNGRTGSNLDHGFYLCGKNESVINNLMFRNAACGLQVAGYNTVSNMRVYNNVIARNGTTGIILWMSLSGVDIKNNILYGNGRYGLNSYAAHGSGVVVDRNLSFANASGHYNFTAGGSDYSYTLGTSFFVDPLFINGTSSGFDAHLSGSSPALKNGFNLSSAFTTDIDGTTRSSSEGWDLGAYSYAPPNTAPSISTVPNQTTTAGVAVGPLSFQVSDVETAASSLVLSATSSNPTLVPTANIGLGGSGTDRTVTIQPASAQIGTAMIEVKVSDGSLSSSSSFSLTVNAAPAGPVKFESTSGSLSGPFFVTNGAIAQPVYTGLPTSGGRAAYNFSVPTAGNYVVSAQLNAPSIDNNSLFVNIDAEPSDPLMIWDIPVTSGFATRTASWRGSGTVDANQYAPKVFYLSAGAHQLVLRGREGKCQVGTITIAPANTAAASTVATLSMTVTAAGSTTEAVTTSTSTTSSNSTVSETVLPLPWQAVDIGAVGSTGASSESDGTYRVSGAGSIGGTADGFRFVYQPLSGDGEILARIDSVENTGAGARAGVMIRESLTSRAKCAFISYSPGGTLEWQSRTNSSGMLSATNAGKASIPNCWVRLSRSGDNLQGYVSTDGTNWNRAGSETNVMASNVYIGLAVGSGSATNNTSAFSNVIVTP